MSSAQSPPKSQEEEDSIMIDATSHPASTETESFAAPRTPPNSGAEKIRSDANSLNDKEKKDISHDEPGSAWQNKKFAEEYERAFSMLQDQQWSMAQYGDPLLK